MAHEKTERFGEDRPAHTRRAAVAKGMILLATVGVALAVWSDRRVLSAATLDVLEHPLGLTLFAATQLLLAAGLLAFLWRVMLVWRYRPCPECGDNQLPSCTVIVPAYNEGPGVLLTLRSIVRADYPADRLQIIAIDDGSDDDTWLWIARAAEESPSRIETLRLPANRGKRGALCEGFRRSRGEILITADSDSIIEPQALKRLASRFVTDPQTGAVAGNVRVWNRCGGILPHMLDVGFLYSFEFMRASQGAVRTVLCAPGALSAYRRSVVIRCLPQWMAQRFRGRDVRVGEDRSLTNLILRRGHHVHFQQDAVVHTRVPASYRRLCGMLLRWGRSDVVETVAMTRFIFRRFRQTSAAGARVNLLLHWAHLLAAQILPAAVLAGLLWRPRITAEAICAGVLLHSLAPAGLYLLRRRSSDGLWALPYGLFWLVGLSWIAPYALLTAHRGGWLTRGARKRLGDVTPAAPSRTISSPHRISGHSGRSLV